MPGQSERQSVRSTQPMCRRNRFENSINKPSRDGRYLNYRLLLVKGCLYIGIAARNHYLVALFVNTVAFNGRCIPLRHVARRPHTLGMLASRALRCGRLGHLGASPYLRTGPLSLPSFWPGETSNEPVRHRHERNCHAGNTRHHRLL